MHLKQLLRMALEDMDLRTMEGHEVMILILFEKIGTICWLTGHALLRDVIGLFPHQLGCLGYRPYLYGSINPSLKRNKSSLRLLEGWRKRGYGTAIYRKTTIPWRTHPSAPWMMKMWMFTLLSMISRVSSVTFCVLAALELALVVERWPSSMSESLGGKTYSVLYIILCIL